MGSWVGLELLPWRVEPRAWGEVYAESLRLVEAAGLVDERFSDEGGAPRPTLTRALAREGPERGWRIVGDAASGRVGEAFAVAADLVVYRRRVRRSVGAGAADVLLEELAGRRRASARVFEGRTPSPGCHRALLGVALLVEDRFPAAAVTTGDARWGDAEEARRWASDVLDRRLELPVVHRGDALYARLAGSLAGDALCDAWWSLHRPADEDAILAPLVARLGEEALTAWFARKLARAGAPGLPVARKLLAIWRRSAGDVEAWRRMACDHPAGPRWGGAEVAAVLEGEVSCSPRSASTWSGAQVTIPP